MTQQVNLHQASLNWEDNALPASLVLQVVGAAVGVLVLVYLVTWFRASSVTGELDHQVTSMQELNLKLADYSERIGHRMEDGVLSSRVVALREQLEAKKRLLEALSNRSEGNSDGFSPHLAGLARRTVDGVWLRSIKISKGGQAITLVGSTLDAESVPVLLQELGNEVAFAGRDFQTFKLDQSNIREGAVDFVIATEQYEGGTP